MMKLIIESFFVICITGFATGSVLMNVFWKKKNNQTDNERNVPLKKIDMED